MAGMRGGRLVMQAFSRRTALCGAACGVALSTFVAFDAPVQAQQRSRAEARLERLRERSAQHRWDQLRSQWSADALPESPLGVWNQPASIPQAVAPAEPSDQAPATATAAAAPAPGPAAAVGKLAARPAVRSSKEPPVSNAALGVRVETSEPVATIIEEENLPRPFPSTFTSTAVMDPPAVEAAPPEEKVFSLFDVPATSRLAIQNEPDAGAPLQAPPAAADREYAPLAPADIGMQPQPDPLELALPAAPLEPIPFTQILPYHDYAPEGATLCPAPEGRCPEIVPIPNQVAWDRCFPQLEYQWVASNVFYNPLYFEDPQLERYGHTHGMIAQPFVSLGKFGLQFVGLPYQKVMRPPHSCEYPLGWYRPGECAPKQVPQIPLNAGAAAYTAGFYTGLFAIFPDPF
jgi:hypothetical protein